MHLPGRHPAVASAPALALGAILAGSVLIKLGLIVYLEGRVYADVLRSLNFGLGLEEGLISVRTHVDNTKSFVGPMLNATLYHAGGVWAIKLFNLLAFVCLYLTTASVGRNRYDSRVLVVSLFLLAFYTGGHRNVAAGEIEDNLASLLFGLALLAHLKTRRVLLPAVVMGVAFLVKFWIAIFVGGFGLFLLTRRRWRDCLLTGVGSVLPVLLITLLDEGATMVSLLMTAERQQGYSTWPLVAFKMLTTGLLPTVLVSAWTVMRRPCEDSKLFLYLVVSYFAYVLTFRDAHAVSFVMMLCLVPAGFLVAEFLVCSPAVGGAASHGRVRLAAVLGFFAVANAGNAWLNLYRDTDPVTVAPAAGAERLRTYTVLTH